MCAKTTCTNQVITLTMLMYAYARYSVREVTSLPACSDILDAWFKIWWLPTGNSLLDNPSQQMHSSERCSKTISHAFGNSQGCNRNWTCGSIHNNTEAEEHNNTCSVAAAGTTQLKKTCAAASRSFACMSSNHWYSSTNDFLYILYFSSWGDNDYEKKISTSNYM